MHGARNGLVEDDKVYPDLSWRDQAAKGGASWGHGARVGRRQLVRVGRELRWGLGWMRVKGLRVGLVWGVGVGLGWGWELGGSWGMGRGWGCVGVRTGVGGGGGGGGGKGGVYPSLPAAV